jgi:6-phosphogluconolactonase (cycloisomerase 2 family)
MWQVPILSSASLYSLLYSFTSSVSPPTAMRLSLPLSGLVTSAVATNLYVSSYSGTITSLQLTPSPDGSYSLRQVAVNNGSEPNPSWLTKDHYNDVIYCVDEGLTIPNGSLSSYRTSRSGVLTQIDRHTVISGPVSSVVYNGGKALAVAH